MSNPWLPEPFEVTKVKRLVGDITSFELKATSGNKVNFKSGQFNMLYAFGVGEIPISISGGGKDFFHHTVRAVGKASQALVDLKPGMKVGLRGPFGTSWPLESAKGRDLIIAAGGLGLAPVRPIVQFARENLKDFGSCHLLYGTRSPDDIIFKEDLKSWKKAGVHVHVTVDYSTPEWKGRVGVVTKLIPLLDVDWSNVTAMMCGPEIMMRFVAAELESSGVNRDQIFVSLERNMKCAFGHCGHCQFGAEFICKDGPVFSYERVAELMRIREL